MCFWEHFEKYTISDIIACIEGEPEVATSSVHYGTYTHELEGLPTEVTENEAQRVTYDIRFRVRVPGHFI